MTTVKAKTVVILDMQVPHEPQNEFDTRYNELTSYAESKGYRIVERLTLSITHTILIDNAGLYTEIRNHKPDMVLVYSLSYLSKTDLANLVKQLVVITQYANLVCLEDGNVDHNTVKLLLQYVESSRSMKSKVAYYKLKATGHNVGRYKIHTPEPEVLANMVRENGLRTVGKSLNVSRETVRKRIAEAGIVMEQLKPGRPVRQQIQPRRRRVS